MPDQHVFEYAVIRFVPRVERGEFINIGVIVLCKLKDFLEMKVQLDEKRLTAFSRDVDIQVLSATLHTWDLICQGNPEGGPVARLDPANRFRWLTAAKSTIIQCSQVHPGLCTHSKDMVEDLFHKYVS